MSVLDKWIDNADKGIKNRRPDYIVTSANRLCEAKRNDMAEVVLQKGLQAFPGNAKLFSKLAKLITDRDPEGGYRFSDKYIGQIGEKALYHKVVALKELKRDSEAIQELEAILKRNPEILAGKWTDSRYYLSILFSLYYRNDEFDKGLKLIEPLLETSAYQDTRMRQWIATFLNKTRQKPDKVLQLLENDSDSQSLKLKHEAKGILYTNKTYKDVYGDYSGVYEMKEFRLKIFISHSDEDVEIAKSLIDILETSFNLENKEIRCTSVPGYKLPIGVHTSTKLRAEIQNSEIVIGIITPKSILSSYVLFELGASWGLERPIIPLLAQGATYNEIPGPLIEQNASNLTEISEVYEVIETIKNISTIPAKEGVSAKLSVMIKNLTKISGTI